MTILHNDIVSMLEKCVFLIHVETNIYLWDLLTVITNLDKGLDWEQLPHLKTDILN